MFIEDLALVRPTQLGFVPRVWGILRQQFDGDTDAFRTHVPWWSIRIGDGQFGADDVGVA